MKMTVVDSVPNSGYPRHNLQAMLAEFMGMPAICVRLQVNDYKSSSVASSVIRIAAVRSGYPIKVFKRGDYVYLSKVV